MNAVERRQEIVRLITTNDEAMSGSMLAKELDVSRQVIVQDIALLKAAGYEILSTNKGYVINDVAAHTRVFKVYHTNDQTEDELTTIVDIGGTVVDVFVWHRVYGKIEAKLNVASRRNVQQCIEGLVSGKSSVIRFHFQCAAYEISGISVSGKACQRIQISYPDTVWTSHILMRTSVSCGFGKRRLLEDGIHDISLIPRIGKEVVTGQFAIIVRHFD